MVAASPDLPYKYFNPSKEKDMENVHGHQGPQRMEPEGTHPHEEYILCALRDVCDRKPSSGLCSPCLFGFNSRIIACFYTAPTDFCWSEEED